MIKTKWISVPEYAKLKGKKMQWAYLQVQLGRVKSRKVRSERMVLEIAVNEEVDKSKTLS